MWKKNKYDLILMDIGLPDIDGHQTTRLIRVQELPEKFHIPIVALTAHAADEDRKKCIESGMNAVYSKPLTEEHCAALIKDLFFLKKNSILIKNYPIQGLSYSILMNILYLI